MKTYKILGLLLTYPEKEIWACSDEWLSIIQQEALLPKAHLKSLAKLLEQRKNSANNSQDMINAQSQYVADFDRNTAHSLHLLEHVYGESRERGQAMVDLSQTYQKKGLIINSGELPDYLPLFLEYLSLCTEKIARQTLGEAIDVIAALTQRLSDKQSQYTPIFSAICSLSKVKPKNIDIKKLLTKNPPPPQTLEQLDKEWSEEPAFSKDDCGDCNTLTNFNQMLKNEYTKSN